MTHRRAGVRRVALVGLVVLASLLPACASGSSDPSASAAPDVAAPVAPEGFATVTVVVTLADGSTRELCLWLADTSPLRSRGLMEVTDPELGGLDGMAFVFDDDTSSGFWMKNTLLPLSIAWYADDGSYVSGTDMQPCPEDASTCPSYLPDGPYRVAVEVPLGADEELGLVEGSSIELRSDCAAARSA